jgi:hypothetical protein
MDTIIETSELTKKIESLTAQLAEAALQIDSVLSSGVKRDFSCRQNA